MSFLYSLLITADPLTDSQAAKTVFKAIKRLDILSGKIDIYLPGFHSGKSEGRDSDEIVVSEIKRMKREAKDNYPDYHGKDPVYHVYCESAGDMYFNDVDFCNFMNDIEEACPNFEYIGRTELVVLPSDDGIIIYDEVKSFNLEPFVSGYVSGCSLEEFLLSVLKILKKKTRDNNLQKLRDIESLYEERTRSCRDYETTEITVRIDNAILKHLRWDECSERYFISYSSKNESEARLLKKLLEESGKDVWMAPEGIPASMEYLCVLPAAIRITSRFVVLLSNDSARSQWVRREIEKAVKIHRRIDGVLVDGFSVKDIENYEALDFLLSPVQINYSIKDLLNDKQLFLAFING